MKETDWDERWLAKAGEPLHPDPWLLKILPLLPAGKLLDVACGRGRNALFLASRGYAVHAIDASAEALTQLRTEAATFSYDIETSEVDLEDAPALAVSAYDVVLVFFYLQRNLFPVLMESVRPGGVMAVRTFSNAGSFPGEPRRKEFVLAPGELLRIFSGWEILLHEEGMEPSSKGGSLAGILARRPIASPCA